MALQLYQLGGHVFIDMSKPPELIRSVATYRNQPGKDGHLVIRGGSRAPFSEIMTVRNQPTEIGAWSQWSSYNTTANEKAIVNLIYAGMPFGKVLVDDVMPVDGPPYRQIGTLVGGIGGVQPAGGYLVTVRWRVLKVPDDTDP